MKGKTNPPNISMVYVILLRNWLDKKAGSRIQVAEEVAVQYLLPNRMAEMDEPGRCPECGGRIEMSEGCMKCYCGWSRC